VESRVCRFIDLQIEKSITNEVEINFKAALKYNIMEEQYTTIPLPNFKFSEVIARKAKAFSERYYFNIGPIRVKNDSEKIQTELWTLNNDQDRIQFLTYLINKIIEGVSKHTSACSQPHCRVEPDSQELLYFIYGKLDDYGLHTNPESFTTDEIKKNNTVLNQISYKLDELKAGDNVIYDEIEALKIEIESLKGLYPLGKEKWGQLFKGIIIENLSNKGIDKILAAISPYLMKLFNESFKLLLENVHKM
jgi:hypothetical protein